jgi:RNase adaptor protein for sRNA GlmZ degradation
LFSAVKIVVRLRYMRRLHPDEDRPSIQESLGALRRLLANVRQTIDATFYLFGCVLFVSLANIGNFADNSRALVGYVIFQNFLFQCAFAANAFFVFLVLHLIHWSVSRQLNSCAEHLKFS